MKKQKRLDKRLDDLIDRKDLLKKFENGLDGGQFYDWRDIAHWLRACIDCAPIVDAEKIVRCASCKWYTHGECCHPRYDHLDVTLKMEPFDFCRYGEKEI